MTVNSLIGRNIKCKLGASDGSGFVFCGNMKTLDIDDVDEYIRNSYLRSLEIAKETIQQLSKKNTSYKAYSEEIEQKKARALKLADGDPKRIAKIEEDFNPSTLEHHKWKAEILKKLEYSKGVRKRVNKRLNEYTSIATRKVVETYKSIDEPNTIIILYDGNERGRAWTTKEYIEGVSETDSDREE